MTRFGDFSLLEDLGGSPVADRYKANHASLGGPFFLKVYSRLDLARHQELNDRCEALIGRQHPNLARHLGHGIVDGLPFVVAPFLEGMDLAELSTSLLDRRVTIGLESVLLVLADLATAVGALQPSLTHGDVSLGHVRVGAEGQVWLTGLTTPRSETAGRPSEPHWDLAGVGALAYDLVPLLRGGAQRPPLPAPLDRVVRRALSIGPVEDRIPPPELVDRLGEVSVALKLKPDRSAFAELIRRTARAVEKRSAENGLSLKTPPRAAVHVGGNGAAPGSTSSSPQQQNGRGGKSPADAIPSLDPVDRIPTLEPLRSTQEPLLVSSSRGNIRPAAQTTPLAPRPAPILELIPVDGSSNEDEATTQLLAPSPRAVSVPPSAPLVVPPPVAARTPSRPTEKASLVHHALVQPPQPPAPPIAPPRAPPQPPPPSLSSLLPTAPAIPLRPPGAVEDDADPFAAPPHTDPRAQTRPATAPVPQPRVESSRRPSLVDSESPFGDLPPDVSHEAPPQKAPASLGDTPRAPPSLGDTPRAPAKTGSGMSSPPKTAPPLPKGAGAPKKRPLLADPDEGSGATPHPAGIGAGANTNFLDERTKDATDPDQRASRATQAREDPSVKALMRRGLVTEAALNLAIGEHTARGGRVVEILVARGAVTDDAVADALAVESGRARIADEVLRTKKPPVALVKRLPLSYVLARRVLPLSLEGGVLQLAVADPFEQSAVDELANLLGAASVRVDVVVGARAAITAAAVEAYRQVGIGSMPGTLTTGSTVLLCTASEDKATHIGARLAQEGMRIEHVVDGNVARDIIAGRPPDVVICAHDIAGLNAVSLLLFAREQPATMDLPFFVFGPRGDEALATRLLDLGADDFFSEPLKLDVMLSKVRRAARKGRSGLDDPSVPRGFPIPTPLPTHLDDHTPVSPFPIPGPATAVGGAKSAPTFLENIAMPSLDDLPELPSGFDSDEPAPEPPSMPTGVMGTLRQMALPEIVQSLEMGRKTARVDLVPADGEKGMIAFEGGQIRYAECGELLGDLAFYQLAKHKEGFFRIHYGDKPPTVNIEHPTTYLLLEAMRRMDEEGNDSGGS